MLVSIYLMRLVFLQNPGVVVYAYWHPGEDQRSGGQDAPSAP